MNNKEVKQFTWTLRQHIFHSSTQNSSLCNNLWRHLRKCHYYWTVIENCWCVSHNDDNDYLIYSDLQLRIWPVHLMWGQLRLVRFYNISNMVAAMAFLKHSTIFCFHSTHPNKDRSKALYILFLEIWNFSLQSTWCSIITGPQLSSA